MINISEAQKPTMPHLNYIDTIHNSIDLSRYPFAAECQTPPCIAFVGRMAPEIGPQFAIAIAQHAGLPLKMAGKIAPSEQDFFDQQIKPHIDGQHIQYLGEVNHAQKADLLAKAAVAVFPIIWDEPFGLAMLESMACGTPVIAMNCGPVPDIIADGKSGFICSTISEFVHKIPAALQLNRADCRQYVESLFHPTHRVSQYEQTYHPIIGQVLSSQNNLHTFQRQQS
ncbi:glycosyltransferase [Acaryochloris marina]|uniref:glycosyltransferase n=1 Tax=Acaryochloris marina TaxID=155978 RepID=UPI002017A6CE|nr:glycosyltransferase [Acaryochloris marina]